jgi:hypothetical protein
VRAKIASIAAVLGLSVVGVRERSSADDKTAKDALALVQGRWERTDKDQDGKTVRITKDIDGNKETITYIGEDGTIAAAHQVDFKLEESSGINIFKYFNMTSTAGPDKGKTFPGEFSYIYKVDKQRFVEAVGLMGDDTREPRIVIWTRSKQ